MTSPEDLLVAYRTRRSERTFRRLYRACTPRLLGFARRLTRGDQAHADEIVQESWVRALDRLDRFRPGGTLAAWLAGIAVNCWRESTRRHRRMDTLDTAPAQRSVPSDTWLDRIALRQAIDRLADGYREVLLLHDVEGYSHPEIAGMLGISVGTSKSQLSRARRTLRDRLAE